MTTYIDTKDFKALCQCMGKTKIVSIDYVMNALGWRRDVVKQKLTRYTKQGRIFRVGRNQYSLDPQAQPAPHKNKYRVKLQAESEMVKVLYSCFNAMVGCK